MGSNSEVEAKFSDLQLYWKWKKEALLDKLKSLETFIDEEQKKSWNLILEFLDK